MIFLCFPSPSLLSSFLFISSHEKSMATVALLNLFYTSLLNFIRNFTIRWRIVYFPSKHLPKYLSHWSIAQKIISTTTHTHNKKQSVCQYFIFIYNCKKYFNICYLLWNIKVFKLLSISEVTITSFSWSASNRQKPLIKRVHPHI